MRKAGMAFGQRVTAGRQKIAGSRVCVEGCKRGWSSTMAMGAESARQTTTDVHQLLYTSLDSQHVTSHGEDAIAARNALQAALSTVSHLRR